MLGQNFDPNDVGRSPSRIELSFKEQRKLLKLLKEAT